MKRSGWILIMAGLLGAGCSGDESPGVVCPIVGTEGPALTGEGPWLAVAGGLSETWSLIDAASDTLHVLPGTGFTGRSPNNLDVVGSRLYVVNSGDNNVSVVDLATGRVTGCIDIGTGTNPWAFQADPEDGGRAWVTTFLSGELVELDLAAGRVARRRTVGPACEGLLVTGTRVAVTMTGFRGSVGDFGNGTVVVFDKSTLTEVKRLPVPPNPQFLFPGPDGRIHVICTGDYAAVTGRVVRIEADGSAVRDTLVLGGSPGRAAVSPEGTVYVASFFPGLLAYDGVAFTALHDAAHPLLAMTGFTDVAVVGPRLYAVNFDQDFVVALRRVDHEVVGEALLGDGPSALAVIPLEVPTSP